MFSSKEYSVVKIIKDDIFVFEPLRNNKLFVSLSRPFLNEIRFSWLTKSYLRVPGLGSTTSSSEESVTK